MPKPTTKKQIDSETTLKLDIEIEELDIEIRELREITALKSLEELSLMRDMQSRRNKLSKLRSAYKIQQGKRKDKKLLQK